MGGSKGGWVVPPLLLRFTAVVLLNIEPFDLHFFISPNYAVATSYVHNLRDQVALFFFGVCGIENVTLMIRHSHTLSNSAMPCQPMLGLGVARRGETKRARACVMEAAISRTHEDMWRGEHVRSCMGKSVASTTSKDMW